MKSRWLAITIAGAFALSLAGCGEPTPSGLAAPERVAATTQRLDLKGTIAWQMKQPAWTSRTEPAMAYLSPGKVLVFGGENPRGMLRDTWELDAAGQATLVPLPVHEGGSPSARAEAAMANIGEGKVLLYGGRSADGPLDDVWEYSAGRWTRAASGPPKSYGHAFSADGSGRALTLLPSGELWQWESGVWSKLTPLSGNAPAGRTGYAFAYDPRRDVHVLFGGYDGSSYVGDVWEWDGQDWSDVTPPVTAPQPSARTTSGDYVQALPAGAGDGLGEVMIVAGRDATGDLLDVWSWSGSSWTSVGREVAPRSGHRVAKVADTSLLVLGGQAGSEALSDAFTITFNAGPDDVTPALPLARTGAAIAATSSGLMMFGGEASSGALSDELRSWDGSRWAVAPVSFGPSARRGAALASDGGSVVLFGGEDASGAALGDTWLLNGTAWTPFTAGGPEPRKNAGLVYVPEAGGYVLYGGVSGPGVDDYPGATWVLRADEWLPDAVEGPLGAVGLDRSPLAYADGRAFLFGGQTSAGSIIGSELSSWTPPSGWEPVADGSPRPDPRYGHGLLSIPGEGLLLLGGHTSSQVYREIWLWDQTKWTELGHDLSSLIPYFEDAIYAYDAARGAVVLVGGTEDSKGTWEAVNVGTACADATECASGFCVDGVCCDRACDGVCETCSDAMTGRPDGVCGPKTQGESCGGCLECDAYTGACEPAGGSPACATVEYADDLTCAVVSKPDGTVCPGGECIAGTCVTDPPPPDPEYGASGGGSSGVGLGSGFGSGSGAGAGGGPNDGDPDSASGCSVASGAGGASGGAGAGLLIVAAAAAWMGRRRRRG